MSKNSVSGLFFFLSHFGLNFVIKFRRSKDKTKWNIMSYWSFCVGTFTRESESSLLFVTVTMMWIIFDYSKNLDSFPYILIREVISFYTSVYSFFWVWEYSINIVNIQWILPNLVGMIIMRIFHNVKMGFYERFHESFGPRRTTSRSCGGRSKAQSRSGKYTRKLTSCQLPSPYWCVHRTVNPIGPKSDIFRWEWSLRPV